MKKVKIGALLLGLMATLSLSACGENDVANSVDVPTTISYDTLEMMAVEPSSVSKNYSITTYDYGTSLSLLKCYDSMLGIDSNGYLINIETGNTVFGSIPTSSIYNYSSNFNNQNNYFCSTTYPIVLYTTSLNNNSNLCIVDSYGNAVYSSSFGSYYYIESANYKRVDSTLFFTLSISGYQNSKTETKTFYYRYVISSNVGRVVEITSEDYTNAKSSTSYNQSLIYNDGLITIYSKDGNIAGYYYVDDYYLFNIYDKNKAFLNSVNPSSFGIDDKNGVKIGNYIFFYKNVEYYTSELDKGSEKKYKNKCLIIDLSNGKVSYNEDFKYYIASVKQESYDTDSQSKYAIVNYYELKEDRTLSNILKCSIMTDELDFSKSFAYDGTINSVTKISSDYLVAKIDNNYYLISKDSRILLNGLTNFVFYADGNIMYKNSQDNLYYYVSSNELVSKYKEINTGFGYVSLNKYNGKNIGCKYDSTTSNYTYGSTNVKSDYLSYINYGIIVCENDVFVVNQKISNNKSEVKVSSVSLVLNKAQRKIISISYDDGSSQCVKLTYNSI